MTNEKVKIKKEDLLTAYNAATEDQKEVLETLFGLELFKPKDITERVKTFEDACNELGDNHPFVYEYQVYKVHGGGANDIISYLKLRIIVAALNEGWEPQFTREEIRWFPHFYIGGSAINGSLCGLSASNSYYGFADTYSGIGARLAFKTKDLADYAGKQFVDIYRGFLIP